MNAMLISSGVSYDLWGEAILSANYILNKIPRKKTDVTPYKLWKDKKPSYKYIRVWGCLAKVTVPPPKALTIGPKTVDCIFIGYAHHSNVHRKTHASSSKAVDEASTSRAIDDTVHDERHERPEIEEGELRRRKRPRIEKSFGPDFVSYMVEDDILIIGSNDTMIKSTKDMLKARFDMKDLGLADVILGVQITRTQNGIILSQSHYVDKILEKFNKDDTCVASTPIDKTHHLSKNRGEGVAQLEDADGATTRKLIKLTRILLVQQNRADGEEGIFFSSSLRWGILRRALISSRSDDQSETSISRKANRGFSLIPFHLVEEELVPKAPEARVCYTLPNQTATKLYLYQRVDNCANANLDDFRICNTFDIDNTGLVCAWPSEEVLAYYCLSQLDLFRSKKVIELGSGYGLAGLVIAAVTEASEVVISDGNPQVVDYIQRNITANSSVFGSTKVKSMMLHWNREELSNVSNSFDIIVASDCTFFKEFHTGLVKTVKCLLKKEKHSEAIFLGPKRGSSLDDFLVEVKESGLQFTVDEIYDQEIWRRHESFMKNNSTWPNYEKDHCYPLLVRVTL
ncbi:calmodulin-lysine N-methyltransferase-like [Bidens hawaiensis]|uniref:calmodulin-lysine N-methyltransferase-like n=1 Tax=Bidens hawaiensis TaxID=980011 RepID=UPI00404AE082